MGLRATFESMAIELADEIVALVLGSSLREIAETERHFGRDRRTQRIDPETLSDVPPGAAEPSVVTSASERPPAEGRKDGLVAVSLTFTPEGTIHVPQEGRALRMDDLLLSSRLTNALLAHGCATLGDLDGRAIADVARIRGVGRKCLAELRGSLRALPPLAKRPRGHAESDRDQPRT